MVYPSCKRDTIKDKYFGVTVADPYRWMENDTSKDLQTWLSAQQKLTEKYGNKYLNPHTTQEMIAWNAYSDFDVLDKDGLYYFHFRYQNMHSSASLYYQNSVYSEPDVLIDPEDYGREIQVGPYAVSKDSRFIAFGTSKGGSDWKEIHIKNIKSKKDHIEILSGYKGGNLAWKGNGFYYTRFETPPEHKMLTAVTTSPSIYYHRLGTPQEQDQFVFKSIDKGHDLVLAKVTSDERFLILHSTVKKEDKSYDVLYYQDFKDPLMSKPRLFLSIPDAHNMVIDNFDDSLIIVSNYKAPNGMFYTCNPNAQNKIKPIISEFSEQLVSARVMDKKLVCFYSEAGSNLFGVFSMQGDLLHHMKFPLGSNINGFTGSPQDSSTIYYFMSFTHPPVVYKLNLRTFKSEPVSQTRVTYNFKEIVTEQVYFYSKDSTKVPMILVHKKKLKQTGQNPCLLYGYGGFGISATGYFDPGLIYFFNQGGMLAVPGIRGGGEYGDEWHAMGKREYKQNSFDDFIAAAEYLIKENYTTSSKLAMMGASNGGLLTAAVMLQKPELFRAVVSQVGVFDMLRFHHYTVGRYWAQEYGCSTDSVDFLNLIKYSPLHNVSTTTKYPSVLIITGDHDDRVVPMHSFKFAATLQNITCSDNPILLLHQKNSGHSGSRVYDKRIKESAYIYGFIWHELKN